MTTHKIGSVVLLWCDYTQKLLEQRQLNINVRRSEPMDEGAGIDAAVGSMDDGVEGPMDARSSTERVLRMAD